MKRILILILFVISLFVGYVSPVLANDPIDLDKVFCALAPEGSVAYDPSYRSHIREYEISCFVVPWKYNKIFNTNYSVVLVRKSKRFSTERFSVYIKLLIETPTNISIGNSDIKLRLVPFMVGVTPGIHNEYKIIAKVQSVDNI